MMVLGYPEVPHKEKPKGFLSSTMLSDDTKPQKDIQNTSLTAERQRGFKDSKCSLLPLEKELGNSRRLHWDFQLHG